MNGWGIGCQYTGISPQQREDGPMPATPGPGTANIGGETPAWCRPVVQIRHSQAKNQSFGARLEPAASWGIEGSIAEMNSQRYRTRLTMMVADSSLATAQVSNGFTAQVGGDEARRQFRMSVGVVAMLAIGIVSAAATVGSHPLAARRDVVSSAPITTLHADSDVVGAKAI